MSLPVIASIPAVVGAWIISAVAIGQGALPAKVPYLETKHDSVATVTLGKQLFFDPRLSKDGTLSCNSCHNVMSGGEDNRPNSVGVRGQIGGRSSPTVWNAAFLSSQFWDGRAASLEAQAIGPLTNPIEMGMDSHDAVIARLKTIPGYVESFEKAFPGKNSLNIDNLASAIASFERTLVARNSPYDRFVNGEKKALSKSAQDGLAKVSEVGCLACHSGPNFSGPALPEGTGFFQKFPTIAGSSYEKKYNLTADLGRYQVTKNDADKNMFRVPTWRNIAVTAPYFHNGAVKTLDEAVRVMAKVQLGQDLKDADVKNIVAFLTSLTGEYPSMTMPRLPPTVGAGLEQVAGAVGDEAERKL